MLLGSGVCVCVCVREREREARKERWRNGSSGSNNSFNLCPEFAFLGKSKEGFGIGLKKKKKKIEFSFSRGSRQHAILVSVGNANEAAKAGIPLDHYQDTSQITFAFNDADIIEERTIISVIGRQRLQGKESVIQEKNTLKAAEKLVFIVTEKQYKKWSRRFNSSFN
ncbi:hypothetical protein HYC85_013924 [Camellia sinensis]|uniref:Uncharacterized protein n=1 Tax=Camellia sinensis TaxID=4442 RepID=A0A7J7H5X7_CAMSI|nr:hypothetical protein HYC85_013924 [Camellia sinensis]